MRGLLFAALLTALLPLPQAFAGEGNLGDVRDVILAKDFWEKQGKRGGRNWSDAEQAQLTKLKAASEDDVIRLRASRVLADLAGKVSHNVGKDDDAVVVAGFRYLEANLKNAQVKRMLDAGITHCHVSLNTTEGGVWLLIEGLGNKPSGGLNLRWDAEQKTMVEMAAWGSVK